MLLYIDAAKPKNTIIIIVIVSSPDRHMEPKCTINCRRPEFVPTPLPESPRVPMEFLSRSWSASALEVSKALAPHHSNSNNNTSSIPEETSVSAPNHNSNNSFSEDFSTTISSKNQFSFASSATSQLVLERIMSQSAREVLLNVTLSDSLLNFFFLFICVIYKLQNYINYSFIFFTCFLTFNHFTRAFTLE